MLVREYANQILGMQLITHRQAQKAKKVRDLLIEEGADIQHEYYVAALTDRTPSLSPRWLRVKAVWTSKKLPQEKIVKVLLIRWSA